MSNVTNIIIAIWDGEDEVGILNAGPFEDFISAEATLNELCNQHNVLENELEYSLSPINIHRYKGRRRRYNFDELI